MVAVGFVCLAVVFGGFVEERSCDEDEYLVGGDAAVAVVVELVGCDVFGYFVELFFGDLPVGEERAAQLGEIDPGGDGCFEEGDVFVFAVGVVAEVGVAGFDEDDGSEAYLAQDGGEEDAGVDAVGLTCVVDFVEEADVLDVGAWVGVGGAGDGGVGNAAVEGIVPYGEGLVGDVGGARGLVALEFAHDALVEDVAEYLLDGGMFFVDVGGEKERVSTTVPSGERRESGHSLTERMSRWRFSMSTSSSLM